MPRTKAEAQGTPADLLSAFAQQATKWSAGPTPDAAISASVALGWRVGEALTWTRAAAAGTDDAIDRLGDQDAQLPPSARWAVLVGQIEAASSKLSDPSGTTAPRRTVAHARETPERSPGAGPPPSSRARDAADAGQGSGESAAAFRGNPPPATTENDAEELRDELLEQLYVTDESRGKAFRLGYELQQLCADPSDADLGDLQTRARRIQVLLVALASKLPANTAHSVRNSLILWEDQLRKLSGNKSLADTLYQQGAVWRTMLSGEVAPTDLLRLSDYVGTAEEVIGRIRELAVRTLKGRLLVLAIGVLALLVAGIALLVIFNDNPGGVTAGAGSLIAAFGLTWKGIGTALGRAAARAEQALWDAQIDWTIAYRATLTESQPAGSPERRADHVQEHVATWKAWKQKWPDLDVVDDRPITH